MKKCVLEIVDEVNIRFHNLDINTRRKLVEEVKFFLPYARHTPAFKLGRWDGCIRYCDIGGRSYINLLDKLLPIVQQQGYDFDIVDQRLQYDFKFNAIDQQSYSHIVWPEGHRYAGKPIEVMDHQVEAINAYLENLQAVQSISTGAGKTLITGILSHKVEPYGRSIVIVPSKDLVTQTEELYQMMGLDVGVFFGDRKEYGKTHTICTWQSLEVLNKKSKTYDPDITLEDFIEGVVCIMVDEAHGAKAEILKKLMTTIFAGVPIRWGMTGTIPRAEEESYGVISTIGPVVNKISAVDLQEKGILANLHIDILQTTEFGEYKQYAEEYKFLTTNDNRIKWLAEHIEEKVEAGNTLILVNRIETGKKLLEQLPEATFISGTMKSKDRKTEYKSVQGANSKIIIATYGVAAVGIDIPRIFNLYLFEPGKSFIRVIQSIGRGIRKAEDKDFVQVYDICANLKFSKRHLTERKKFYNEQGYPFKVKKV